MGKKAALAIFALLVAGAPASAGNDTQWLHVAVDGTSRDPERVRVNLPLSLVHAVLPLIEDHHMRKGRIRIDGEHFRHEDIVEVLRALGEAEDGEYVTVKDRFDHVRIAKKGEYVTLQVEETRRRGSERVDVKIPVSVLEALVSGRDDELDLAAAIHALGKHGGGDLITVDDDGTQVRIWIDNENTPAEEDEE